MKYIDFDPLGNYVTLNLKLSELEKLVNLTQNEELKNILERAKTEKQEYLNYSKQNERMSLRLWNLPIAFFISQVIYKKCKHFLMFTKINDF